MSGPSLGLLAAAIQRGQSEIGHARSAVLAGRAKVEAGLQALVRLAEGSGRAELPTAIAQLVGAVRHAEYGAGAALRADDHLRDYLLERGLDPGGHRDHPAVRDLFDPVRSRPGTHVPEAPVWTAEEARERAMGNRREFFDAALPDEEVRRLLGEIPVKSLGDKSPTEGVWISVTGRQEHSRTIRQEDTGDLRYIQAVEHWRVISRDTVGKIMWDLDTVRHAEVIAAVQLVIDDVRHGSIAINHPTGPCGGRLADCRAILGAFLPKGTSLAIHWPGGGYMLIAGRGYSSAP